MKLSKTTALVALAVSSGLATTYSAVAQTAPSTSVSLEEIVVTATRHEQALSKVPASVAAYTQRTLDEKSIRGIEDIARLTPGVAVTDQTDDLSGLKRSISIRGISSDLGTGTTGIYIDDTPIQVRQFALQSSNAYPQLFDLDRVEVLRGPQGTLFGAGAEGGVVRFITPRPDLTKYSGFARSELASTKDGAESYELGAAFGGPIIPDHLAFRVSAFDRRNGGYVDRVDPDTGQLLENNSNSDDTFSARGAMRWTPNEKLDVTLSVFHQRQRGHGAPILWEPLSNLDSGIFRNGRREPQSNEDTFTLPSLNVEYDFSAVKLISTTSALYRHAELSQDYTNYIASLLLGDPRAYLPTEYSLGLYDDHYNSFTQEFRLQSPGGSRLFWTVGAFYSRATQAAKQFQYDPFIDAAFQRVVGVAWVDLFGYPLTDSVLNVNGTTRDTQRALFGEVSYEIVDGLRLIAGVRAARTEALSSIVTGGGLIGPVPLLTQGAQKESPVTPKFGVSWQLDPNHLVYTTAAKGYRIGGPGGGSFPSCDDELAQLGLSNSLAGYKSDTTWSYELGSKNKFMNGRLQIDASAFHIKWKDIQRLVVLASCGGGIITNFGDAASDGADIAMDFLATEHLRLEFNLGYTHARLTETVSSPTGVVYGASGDELRGSPWSGGVSGEYKFHIMSGHDSYARADYQYTGRGAEPNYAIFGTDPELRATEKFNQLSLRFGVHFGKWEFAAFVNNALNEAPLFSRTRDTLVSPLFYNLTTRPRTMGLTASIIF
jgi:iron complex outermembrane recepter protein